LVAAATTTAVSATTSAATTTAESTAASTAATTESTAATTATGALFFGSGFIDGQGTTVVFLAVEGRDGGLGLFLAGHFDKAKTLAAARIAIVDDLGRHHRAVCGEKFFQS
jgi:hypothetical protein